MRSICLSTANTLKYPQGGHLWVFLNWALGFRSAGLDVVWLDMLEERDDRESVAEKLGVLRERIAPWGFGDRIALIDCEGRSLSGEGGPNCLGADDATSCDLLFNLRYNLPHPFVRRFRKTALLDIDPGLLQYALRQGAYDLAPHDRYFSIGRNLDRPFLDTGHKWITVRPCVHVESWPVRPVPPGAAFSTVAHWTGDYMVDESGEIYPNDKRAAFAPYLGLPHCVPAPMELALALLSWDMVEEKARLEERGWRVRDAHEVAGSPAAFQHYVQQSLGEFSCAKASCIRMPTGWISDRTVCYLAAGRPAVVQWTGEIPELPQGAGLLRFTGYEDAERFLRDVVERYDFHAAHARKLAEEFFSSSTVIPSVLNAL